MTEKTIIKILLIALIFYFMKKLTTRFQIYHDYLSNNFHFIHIYIYEYIQILNI